MVQNIIVALGAGLASALLFVVPAKGTMGAAMIGFFAPLPVMIAGLAFTPATALIGAFAGAAGSALVLHPLPAAIFALWAALPAWWLTRLAWLARPAQEGENASPDGLVWYPAERLVLWSAAWAGAVTAVFLLAGVLRFGGFAEFYAAMHEALTAAFERLLKLPNAPKTPKGMNAGEMATFALRMVLPHIAAWGCLMLTLNIWLAGRIAQTSQRLKRPWTDIAATLRLPQNMAYVLAAALALAMFTGGLPRTIGAIAAAACGMAFALQGFAVMHAVSRGLRNRTLNLTMIYMLNIFLYPVPLVLTALFGAADSFLDFRGRFQRPPRNPPPGSSGWPPPPANSN
ncbi:MAG: hypothetical protein AB7F96_18115 [Beijerinckiaceae bacterium]